LRGFGAQGYSRKEQVRLAHHRPVWVWILCGDWRDAAGVLLFLPCVGASNELNLWLAQEKATKNSLPTP